MSSLRTVAALAGPALAASLALGLAATPASAKGAEVFVPSATVNGSTVTLPLHQGRTATGAPTWFVVIEASNSKAADAWRVDVVNKLENTGAGAQRVTVRNRVITFAGTVDFTPERVVVPGPGGFPPAAASPGSVGDAAYSPIVRLPDGSFLNAPQIGNATGWHDKVVSVDQAARTVTLQLTDGFARGEAVRYLSTDATDPAIAALEGSTLAPKLVAAPSPGDDSTKSARSSLAAFVNGPTGDPATRQGVNSALLGEGDPLNVLAWRPGQGRYSPLWDVHATAWAPGTTPVRVTEFADVEDLAEDGDVTGPGGAAWGPIDVIVNCPVIATA